MGLEEVFIHGLGGEEPGITSETNMQVSIEQNPEEILRCAQRNRVDPLLLKNAVEMRPNGDYR